MIPAHMHETPPLVSTVTIEYKRQKMIDRRCNQAKASISKPEVRFQNEYFLLLLINTLLRSFLKHFPDLTVYLNKNTVTPPKKVSNCAFKKPIDTDADTLLLLQCVTVCVRPSFN